MSDASRLALFTRAFGLVLLSHGYYTLASHQRILDSTAVAFSVAPFHFELSPVHLPVARNILLFSGLLVFSGILARIGLLLSFAAIAYSLLLDRSLYNNHHYLLAELCVLLAVCDGSVLRWRWRWSRAAPRAPRWQLHAVQALVLTPYFYGGLAKLNPDWLFRHEPVATWAPAMLQTLDDTCGGALDAALPDEFDVITPFATFVSWGGLLFDLLVPFLLVGPSPTLRYGVAFPAALAFHACNRLWFGGLGVFPALCVVALVLFIPERTHRGEVDNIVVSSIPRPAAVEVDRKELRAVFKRACPRASPEGVEACVSYYFRFMTMTGTASLRDEYSKGAFQSGVARYLNKYLQPEPCVGGADILAHAKAYANGEIDGGEAPAPPPARRRPLLVAAAVAVGALHSLVPLRHLLLPEASRWTGEGSLWAWHMKLSAKRGWLALHVAATDADGAAREFTLVPETDPSLYADQAGHLTHEPASTLQYARHLRALFAAKGYAVASVRASSCVAVNGRPAQPLFVADADLLAHADGDYLGVFALRSGVGAFLNPWGSAAAASCDLARPQGAADDDAAAAVQRASDAAYRWLHAPLHRRAALAEWAWVGRSRVPSALADAGEACDATERDALPSWATRCSFLSAAEALWCPE